METKKVKPLPSEHAKAIEGFNRSGKIRYLKALNYGTQGDIARYVGCLPQMVSNILSNNTKNPVDKVPANLKPLK